ncbi:phage holin family protein [Actinacidiphila soli]|jgi:hypothetical protein|uniref:phage holin family protein n=1 Tax=Actinacidiphila soli TaxID=2487275 RepID=UPI000FCBC685|nr:phage holin family protein [Actinacidiphila soli]
MNSAQHLLNEDRADFERALDEVLHSSETQAALGDGGNPLNTEQLRTMALSAVEPIAACAAPEYQHYRKVREQVREATEERQRARVGSAGPTAPTVSSGMGYAAAVAPVADPDGSGAGLFAVVAVLTPMLAGAAAVIVLVVGYALRLGHPVPAIAAPLISVGWLFAGVAVFGIVVAMVGLLLTALRNGATALHDGPDELPPEVALARAAWRRALLERGLRPFLAEALAKAADAPHAPAPSSYDGDASGPRMPRLGYSRPDFTSPGPEESPEPGRRFTSPDFTSPDFTSPDFGGPENKPN